MSVNIYVWLGLHLSCQEHFLKNEKIPDAAQSRIIQVIKGLGKNSAPDCQTVETCEWQPIFYHLSSIFCIHKNWGLKTMDGLLSSQIKTS